MKQRITILNSKLTVSLSPHTLQRSRLTGLLREITRKKVALVVAGAGYGKTTLVAQTVAETEARTLWYCLDESDRDFAVFMSYLIAGIRKHQPEFGTELAEKLSLPSFSRRKREALLPEFLAEVERCIREEMILVLDDYYLVQDHPDVSGTVEFFLARTPPSLHWIIISRTEPALRVSRYRAMLEVIDITEADLAFRADEIGDLCRTLPDMGIGAANIPELFEKTGGWAAALILSLHVLKGKPSGRAPASLPGPIEPQKLIFRYIRENVFERQPAEIREFMLGSSLLSRIDPNFCDVLFGTGDSRKILNTFCEHHLLTFPCNDATGCFQYHHLLRDFLRNELEESLGIGEVRRLRYEIGKLSEHRGDIREAMHHFLEGLHFEEICRIIIGMRFSDLVDCPLRFLTEVFERIPAERIRKDPGLLHMEARLVSLRGETRKAVSGFQVALERFRTDDDPVGVANCLKELGFHYYLTGDVLRAKQQMEALWGKPHKDPFFPAEVAGYLIFFSAILGRMEEADHYYRLLRKSFAGRDAPGRLIRSWADLCYSNRIRGSGDFDKAHELNEKILDAFTRMGPETFLPLACFQSALTSFYRVKPEEGCGYAEKGLSKAQKIGIYDHQYGWLLYVRGLNRFGKGETDKAVRDAEESLDVFKNHDHVWGEASVYELLAMIRRKNGKPAEAEDFIRTGRNLIHGLNLAVTDGALTLRLAELLTDRGDYPEALSLLEKHREEIGVSEFHLFQSSLLHSRIQAEFGKTAEAAQVMESALRTARARHYDAWVLQEGSWAVPVLVTCHALGRMREYIEEIFRKGDGEMRDRLRSLKREKSGSVRRTTDALITTLSRKSQTPLRIRCLGKFEVFAGDRLIPSGKWGESTKASLLFKYMALRRDRGFIPKEILLEIAWPGEDPDKSNVRFHVALSSLRRLLEPDLRRGIPSSYILRRQDAYRLEIGEAGSLDAEEFLKELDLAQRAEPKDAEEALARYLKAESLYGGALFEEDPYEDAFAEDREKLSGRYLHALRRLIRLCEEKAAWAEAIRCAQKYLCTDPYAEPVYCALMRFYSHCGETSRIVKTFEKCKACITEELGYPMSDSTVEVYRMLTGAAVR